MKFLKFYLTQYLEWDEREEIADPDDTKPDDWEKPEHIADPDAEKPDDWDDDMDGDWEPPMIDNPEYKGIWFSKFTRLWLNHIKDYMKYRLMWNSF